MKFKHVLVSLVPFLALACLVEAHAADYFPLQPGNRWVYTPSFGNGVRTDTVVGTEMLDGGLAYILKREEAAPDNYHEKVWLIKNGGDIECHKIWDNMGNDPAVSLSAPWLYAKTMPSLNDTFPDYEADLPSGVHVKMSTTVESVTDTVSVPAGIFSNCARVRFSTEMRMGGVTSGGYYKTWYAPDTGPVMIKKYKDDTWTVEKMSQELVSFSRAEAAGAEAASVDINSSRDQYAYGDPLKATLSLYNTGDCFSADIYVAIQLPDGTLLFYPTFTPDLTPAFSAVSACGSPSSGFNDRVLLDLPGPVPIPAGVYTWYALVVPQGDMTRWISLDTAPFGYAENP